MTQDIGKSATGLEPNLAGLLCYVAGIVTGIIFLVIEKDNKFIRFHALQSIILFGGLLVVQMALIMTFVLALLLPLINIVALVLWILLMFKAYKGEKYKLPVIGDIAEKNA